MLDRLGRVVRLNPDAPLCGSIANAGHPMQELELWRWWSRVLTQAKVRPRTPENLRHTFVSILLSRGAPLLLVAAQAGHTPAVMLVHYSLAMPQPTAELDHLGDEIAELSAHLEAATASLLALIREFDARRRLHTGFRSCAHCL